MHYLSFDDDVVFCMHIIHDVKKKREKRERKEREKRGNALNEMLYLKKHQTI